MDYEVVRKIKIWLLISKRFIWQRKGLWLRAALCWTVGMTFTLADREHDYDTRMQIRGEQSVDNRIVIINITNDEWQNLLVSLEKKSSHLPDSKFITDSYFWEPQIWQNIISQLLSEKPLVIGITPYFGENISQPVAAILNAQPFTDPRVVWSTQRSDEGRLLKSWFGVKKNKTVGLNEPHIDSDGFVRRLSKNKDQLPSLAAQLVSKTTLNIKESPKSSWLISRESEPTLNYRGRADTFYHMTLFEFMKKKYQKNFFKNKIVIIGSEEIEGAHYQTPLGKMSKDEITATTIDNILNNRWINHPSIYLIAVIFVVFVFFSAWITSRYPQFFALIIIICFNLFYTTLSLWVFDSYYTWTPIFSTALVSIVTYVTFLSFQLTLKDYMNVQLENEKQFLFEIEQLKNNFLSLISHDLKTPIAKIQAICDRLLTLHHENEFKGDLQSLRDVASELHRYIRTILEITRVESRNFSINKDAADMNEIIESVIEQLEPLARNKKINIATQLEPMFLIEVDQILIREVVLNLIENAIKYTPEDGSIKVSSREVDDRVLVMVEDTGPGISAEEQLRVFEKFYRGEHGKSQSKGSGLGLYLVKYFVELHDGKIFIESNRPRHGTKIGFSLPIAGMGELTINEGSHELQS